MKKLIKKLLPAKLLNLGHLFYAWLGSAVYGKPSEKLLVIGITGTSGKSSTIYFLKQLLEKLDFRVGALSTIEFCIAGECQLNDKKMTMLGKMAIQKYLRKMVKAGCDIALVETTSEGAVQHRHKFINYDIIALTNLYPEHIESHGSFENYKAAKLGIFEYVSKSKRKKLKKFDIGKACFVNAESKYKNEFFHPAGDQPKAGNFDRKITFGKGGDFEPTDINIGLNGLSFVLAEKNFFVPIYGEYNIMNIASVIAIVKSLGIGLEKIQKLVSKFRGVPGRIEFIPEAENRGFQVVVDYAFEPVAMAELYKVVDLLVPRKVIHVFGSTGGGRDISRRETVGRFVGEHADICIITDEDPYEDDPMQIIDDVARAVQDTGKVLGKNLFKVLNRGEAIKKAIGLAELGDLVLITGKGSEQAMAIKGKLVPHDDREEARKYLK